MNTREDRVPRKEGSIKHSVFCMREKKDQVF